MLTQSIYGDCEYIDYNLDNVVLIYDDNLFNKNAYDYLADVWECAVRSIWIAEEFGDEHSCFVALNNTKLCYSLFEMLGFPKQAEFFKERNRKWFYIVADFQSKTETSVKNDDEKSFEFFVE